MSSELETVGEAVTALGTSVRTLEFNALIENDQETLRQHALDIIAHDQHLVTISNGCKDLLTRREGGTVPKCELETIVPNGRDAPSVAAPSVNALDADRKLKGVETYLNALNTLARSNDETDIQNAYAAASESFKALKSEADVATLAAIVEGMNTNKGTFDAATSFAVQNLKARRLKDVVASNDQAFQNILRELEAKLISLNVDPSYRKTLNSLIDANEQAQSGLLALKLASQAGDQGRLKQAEASYRSQVVALHDAEEAFSNARSKSVYGKLSALRVTHTALANRLKKPASTEETVEFLKSIKAIADTL